MRYVTHRKAKGEEKKVRTEATAMIMSPVSDRSDQTGLRLSKATLPPGTAYTSVRLQILQSVVQDNILAGLVALQRRAPKILAAKTILPEFGLRFSVGIHWARTLVTYRTRPPQSSQ
jgi:hypothetical protein